MLLVPLVVIGATATNAAASGAQVTNAWALSFPTNPTSVRLGWDQESGEGFHTTVTTASAMGVSCQGCDSLAIAVNIALVGNIRGNNQYTRATTRTIQCNECMTVARAHSFVLGSANGMPQLTQDGQVELQSVRAQLAGLGPSLDADALEATIDGLMDEIVSILLTESYVTGSSGDLSAASQQAYVQHYDARTRSTQPNEAKVATG